MLGHFAIFPSSYRGLAAAIVTVLRTRFVFSLYCGVAAGANSNITMEVIMKPCTSVGAASAIWFYQYNEYYCNEHTGDTCSTAYQDWCCGGAACYTWNDKCMVSA